MQVFDDAEVLKGKVQQLAAAVRQASHLVVYTGAGISTVRMPPPPPLPSSASSWAASAAFIVPFLPGSIHPRLQGAQRGVDAAAEGAGRQVRMEEGRASPTTSRVSDLLGFLIVFSARRT